MNRFNGRSARRARHGFAVFRQFCEPLERRVLLSGDPVIVLTEAFSLTTFEHVNSSTVRPWLWENPQEYLWDLDQGDWNTTDGDGNGYPDEAYGWNFSGGGSPNIIGPHGGLNSAAHGAAIMGAVLHTLNGASSQGDRVRIMHVIGGGSQIVPYLLWHKAQGVNIVAVSNSNAAGATFTRADAETLGDEGVLLFVGHGNDGTNIDSFIGAPNLTSFYHATPRFGTQLPPVHTIIPATTNPAVHATDYGVNSFYFAAPSAQAQSYAAPVAASYAAIAVQAYQDANSGASPTAEQVKRAMMSGVSFISGLDNRTITHDYVDDERQDGGLLDLSKIISAINSTPSITDVSMTPITQNGQTVTFEFNASTPPTNWTISWGDNSFDDQSGVQVRPPGEPFYEHTFRRDIQPHYYYPTLYAMLGTGSNRQVYLPAASAQAQVFVDTEMGLTSGKDEYTLSRSGSNLLVTLVNSGGTFYQTFAPGKLPNTILRLGQGGDTVTIDFSNGDPLEFTALTVRGTTGAENVVRVIGSSGSDTIQNLCFTNLSVNSSLVLVDSTLSIYIDGAGGDDVILSGTLRPTTIIGGDGDDTITVNTGEVLVTGGPGSDILNLGDGNALVRLSGSETFSEISILANGRIVMDDDGSFVLRTGLFSIHPSGFLDLADNSMIIDFLEPPPLASIQPLLTSGYNSGAWNGNGIRSSIAAAAGDTALGFAEATDIFTTFPAMFAGEELENNAVLITYTLYGDANLDRTVNLADFNRLAANFGTESGARWSQGDFNFDGAVNLTDFNVLAANFGSTLGEGDSFGGGGEEEYTYEDLLDMLMDMHPEYF